jgi:hypothetical protein
MSPKKTVKTKKVPALRRTPVTEISPDEQIVGAPLVGKVRSYDARSGAFVVRLEEPLSVGDAVRVKGRDTDLTQPVETLRVAGKAVQSALPGENATLVAADRVRTGDAVYKVRAS